MTGAAAVPATAPRVLIVDDQPDIRRLIGMTLDVEPYRLVEAADADAAWREVLASPPGLVLLDVMMPGSLDGLALCRRIRAEPACAATRVLLLSARADAADRAAGMAAGADGYLVKPFRPLALRQQVEALLGAGDRAR